MPREAGRRRALTAARRGRSPKDADVRCVARAKRRGWPVLAEGPEEVAVLHASASTVGPPRPRAPGRRPRPGTPTRRPPLRQDWASRRSSRARRPGASTSSHPFPTRGRPRGLGLVRGSSGEQSRRSRLTSRLPGSGNSRPVPNLRVPRRGAPLGGPGTGERAQPTEGSLQFRQVSPTGGSPQPFAGRFTHRERIRGVFTGGSCCAGGDHPNPRRAERSGGRTRGDPPVRGAA